jgi:two-component system, LytTR family, response regulator
MLKAIIIDDEPDCVRLLSLQLKMYCPQVEVLAECTNAEEGLALLRQTPVDVVFLDIEMPKLNGFQLLEALGELPFAVVFTTAYDQFAVKAFKYSAIDYLLKPIEAKDLKDAVKKLEKKHVTNNTQLELLKQHLNTTHKKPHDKIALPYKDGVIFVEYKNILYCESDDNYTQFHLLDGHKYLVSKTLREVQEVLEELNFLRIHRQYLVNLDHIKRFSKTEGATVIMSDERAIPVSRSQKDKLIERFGWL